MTKERFNMLVGSIGAFIGVFVFLAYIPQIIANLHGQPSQPWQPLFAAVSCLIWVLSVSYTHLDVYKRQMLFCIEKCLYIV